MLIEKINGAKELKENVITEDYKTRLEKATKTAEEINNKENATQEEVNEAVEKLNGEKEKIRKEIKEKLEEKITATASILDGNDDKYGNTYGEISDELVQPFGSVIININYGIDGLTTDKFNSLEVTIKNDEKELATNKLLNPKDYTTPTISSPFNLGRGKDMEVWAWKRGKYALSGDNVLKEDLPNSVEIKVDLYGIEVKKSVNLENLRIPQPYIDKSVANVTDADGLKKALSDEEVKTINISEVIGSESEYEIYEVNRDDVKIVGSENSKIYGTFIVKGNNVTIDSLAIQNKGDLKGESTNNRGGIYVYAKKVTLTNNTITNGLGTKEGLSNAIQIMSPEENNPLSNYVITGNELIGHDNEVSNWSSSGIVIAQNYKPGSIGEEVKAITATEDDYTKILNENTFINNKINLTHQDWAEGLEDGPVLYVYPNQKTEE